LVQKKKKLKLICNTGQDFPTAIGEREEGEIETNTCMAQDIKACVYQNTGNK